jgi:ketosteroid isomerase-like protein
MLGMGIKRCSFETFEIEEHGDIAFETGRVTLYAEGDVEVDNPKYLVIWKRDGGTWCLYRDIFNSDKPAA